MVKNKIFIFLILLFAFDCRHAAFGAHQKKTMAVYRRKFTKKRKNKFNSILVTKYDVEQVTKLFIHMGEAKKNTNDSSKSRSFYEDMLKKANIARKNGISLSALEKTGLWRGFSREFNIVGSMNDFCTKNKISAEFLTNFLENRSLWHKYFSSVLKRLAFFEVNENIISDYAESQGANDYKTRYDLTEIVAKYASPREKTWALAEMNKLYKMLNSGKSELESSVPTGVEVMKLDFIFEDDLSKAMSQNIKNLKINGICRPFCTGEEKGYCFILRIDGKELVKDANEQKKMILADSIFNKFLNNRVEGLLRDYSSIAAVAHKY
ncbi:MAG: hypothetical protein LBI70_02530 [Rickettsiales bacterium]|jgi:hypothetical protein|nr:hypothetical protein [Rickettsiales bacterium]